MTCHPDGSAEVGPNVATSAWSSPPRRIQVSGSTPSADATWLNASGIANAVECTSMLHATRGRDVPKVGDEAVTHIDHRRRPGLRGLRPGLIRRLRTPMGIDYESGRPESSAQRGKARRSPAQPSGELQRRRRPRTGPGDGRPALEITECGDRDDQDVAAHDVSPDHPRSDEVALVSQPVGEALRPERGEVSGRGEARRVGRS